MIRRISTQDIYVHKCCWKVIGLTKKRLRFFLYFWFGLVLWHINHCWLFYTKSSFYILNIRFVNTLCVAYWPSTEPSIKRCTCVNYRKKQVHPVEDIGISPWPVDVVEFGANACAHRKQAGVKQLYNQVPQTAWVSWSSSCSSSCR